MSKVEKRVRAGIRFLDKQYGKGWRKKIDLTKLNMGSFCDCILGQIGGHYAFHREKLGISGDRATDLGFNLPTEDILSISDYFAQWLILTQTWRRLLRDELKLKARERKGK